MVQLKLGTLVSLRLVPAVVQKVILSGAVSHKMMSTRRKDHLILQVILNVVVVEWIQLVYESVTQAQVLTLAAGFLSLLVLGDREWVLVWLNRLKFSFVSTDRRLWGCLGVLEIFKFFVSCNNFENIVRSDFVIFVCWNLRKFVIFNNFMLFSLNT